MLHKTFEILESKTDADAGTFEATVAVFGNVDKGGDRILPGAFQKTLEKWRATGDPIPVILSHQWNNPMAHIGVADPHDVNETTKGLHVKGRLDIADNDVARQVHRLMQRRSLKEFSFGYEVPKGGEKRAKDGANDLLELDLAEVGPTLKGMNPATELHAVKSALGVDESKDPEQLRKDSERLEREVAESKIPEIEPTPPVEPESAPQIDFEKDLQELKAQVAAMAKSLEDPEQLRKDSTRLEREIAESKLPEGISKSPPASKEPEPDLEKELQEVKATLANTVQALEDLKKKAEADKEPDEARSVDALRKRSEELTLEVASGGMSLRKPPAQVKDKPEPVDLDELKRQSHDLMFEVLSYSTE